MARLLLPGEGSLDYGYFYTRSFDDIIFYLQDLLAERNESFLCTMHASALFRNATGEEQELHMRPLEPVIFDPNAPPRVFDDEIQNMYDALMDPELYDNIQGSGWTLIPGTFTYWVNTIRYQPNNDAHENNRNSFTPPTDDDPDDPAYSDDVNHILNDTFLLSLAAHHVPRSNHCTKILYRKKCERWVDQTGLSPAPGAAKISIANLAQWHEQVFNYHIRVFSENGNIIYHKWYGYETEVIDILYKNRKFSYITNLWTLLKEKRDRFFCAACKKFHSNEELCSKSIKAAKSVNMKPPEFPSGRHHVVFYADFESYIDHGNHKPSGYCLLMLAGNEVINKEIISLENTDDVAGHFIKTLIKLCNEYCYYSDDGTNFCKICGQTCNNGIWSRNYISGEAGLHHKDCWDDIRNCAYVFFHNFRGYDSHYVLGEAMRYCEISTLRGKSFEKFDLISCNSGIFAKFTFKDTFNFFPNSLAQLVKQVVNWRYTPEDARNSKGVFPYEWFDNPIKLSYTNLPPPEFWYNTLTQSQINPEEGFKIWDIKNMKTFNEYHNYYMEIDVLQLTDVFEEFRDAVYNEFKTDPVYCQGSPSLTWQLCLQAYAERIKIITDVNVYIDIQQNIRGGVSQVMTRYVDIEKRGGEILYLDINSLYSACMEELLPTKFIAKINELPPNWEELYTNDNYCAFLCVDLHYPAHLHDKHRFYPLAPHKFNNRLCATFLDRENYLIHARNLKFYLDNGLVLIKFHYGYVFEQDYILKDYVSQNIEKRKLASQNNNKVLVQLYKLLNNSLYGKTCENKFKYRKYTVKDPFVGIFGKTNPFLYRARNWYEIDNKILCEENNSTITLDKPIQIGFTILEFAKLKIYGFYYKMMEYFPEVELIYTDTDSLMMWFPYKEPQKKLIDSPLCFYFDFEKTPDWFNVKTVLTDKVSGKWSLEADKPIKRFVGLRAKTYAIEFQDGTSTLKNKGIVRAAKEEEGNRPLEFSDYLRCLFESQDIYVQQYLIRSQQHSITTTKQRKLALSASDEKRVILADKITTLPFGYHGEMFKDNNTILPSDDNL